MRPAPITLQPRNGQPSAADRVVILAPVGRDGPLTAMLLREAEMRAEVCPSAERLVGMLEAGTGTLLLTEEALVPSVTGPLTKWLRAQPTWSDLPIVLCVDSGRDYNETQRAIDLFGPSSKVIMLDRPLRPDTLVSVVRAALHARRRQYEIRDLLGQLKSVNDELRSLNDGLEQRVRQRTRALEARKNQVQALAADLTTAEQRERSRIAQILHDHLQQLIFGMKLKLQVVRGVASDQERADVLSQADDLADEAMNATRTLAVELDPPVLDEDDMVVVMRWLATYFADTHDFEVEVASSGVCEVRGRELRSLLAQSVRELLFNVAKHADVDEAHVRLEATENDLLIHVIDEGQGFDPDTLADGSTGFGLYSVRERIRLFGADLAIDAAPGTGTHVTIRIPCRVASNEEAQPSSAELGR